MIILVGNEQKALGKEHNSTSFCRDELDPCAMRYIEQNLNHT